MIFWGRIFKIILISFLVLSCIELHSETSSLDDLLDLDLVDLMNIEVVSATKTSQKIHDVPATVHVVTADQIRERGYLTLEECLSDLPGFQFRNIQGFNSYVFQRGVPSQNNLILVLVDGVQINELNSGGFYGGAQYNLANVERIEVVYGPASALYGTNAVSGIINIITKDPRTHQGFSINSLYGSFNTLNTDLSYSYYNKNKDLGFLLSGMYKQSEKADLSGASGDHNWTEDMENFEDDLSFDSKLVYRNLTAGLVYQDKQASRTTNYNTTEDQYLDEGTNWHIRFINSYIKFNYQRPEKWNLVSQIYYRNSTVVDNSIAYIDTTSQVGYFRPNYLLGFETNLEYLIHKNINLVGGIVIEQEYLAQDFSKSYSGSPEEEPPAPSKPDIETNDLQSFYLQVQYSIIRSLKITSGLRFDNSSVYDQILKPRLGVVFSKRKFTTKLLYTEAFRAPKSWDYTDGLGNPDLKPEEMRSLELVSSLSLTDNLRINLALYRNILDGKLVKESVGDNYKWVNSGELNTDGIELDLEYRERHIKAYANYTFTNSKDQDDISIPEISEHSANLGVNWKFLPEFSIDLRGNYLGERKNTRMISTTGTDIVEAAFVLNSALSYNFSRVDLRLIVKNIMDTEYYHTSNRPPDRYRQSQRTILIKIGYRI